MLELEKENINNQNHFYKILLTIAIPIIVQNFLSSSLNMVDNLMIGNLGEASIAAVGQANQLFSFCPPPNIFHDSHGQR